MLTVSTDLHRILLPRLLDESLKYFLAHATFSPSLALAACNSSVATSALLDQRINQGNIMENGSFGIIPPSPNSDQKSIQALWNKHLQRLLTAKASPIQCAFYLETILTNIDLSNQRYQKSLRNHIEESTAIGNDDKSSSSSRFHPGSSRGINKKESIEETESWIESLNSKAGQVYQTMIESQAVKTLFKILAKIGTKALMATEGLKATIFKLIKKYQLQTSNWAQPQNMRINFQSQKLISTLNNILFNYTPTLECKIGGLNELLQKNRNIQMVSLAWLLESNFLATPATSQLFSKTVRIGYEVLVEIGEQLIRTHSKQTLFAQAMETDPLMQLFITSLNHRFSLIYFDFQNLLSEPKRIPKFLRSEIPLRNGDLIQLLGTLYSALQHRHGSKDAVQLIKKLFLNRWVLNPVLCHKYQRLGEQSLQVYVMQANAVRMMFYPKKATVPLQTNLQQSFLTMLQSTTARQFNAEQLHLVVSDYAIARFVDQAVAGTDLKPQMIPEQPPNQDNSMSFGTLKNDSTNRSALVSNHSIRQKLQDQDALEKAKMTAQFFSRKEEISKSETLRSLDSQASGSSQTQLDSQLLYLLDYRRQHFLAQKAIADRSSLRSNKLRKSSAFIEAEQAQMKLKRQLISKLWTEYQVLIS